MSVERYRHATRITRGPLAPGVKGTRQTLQIMARLVADEGTNPVIRGKALEILKAAGRRSADATLDALGALHDFVANRVRFELDPPQFETLQAPTFTLRYGAGDCDDKATLLGALVNGAGLDVPLRFRVVGAQLAHPDRYSHVYVVARHGYRDVPMDATYAGTPMGWQIPGVRRMGDFAL